MIQNERTTRSAASLTKTPTAVVGALVQYPIEEALERARPSPAMPAVVALRTESPQILPMLTADPAVRQMMHLEVLGPPTTVSASALGTLNGDLSTSRPSRASQILAVTPLSLTARRTTSLTVLGTKVVVQDADQDEQRDHRHHPRGVHPSGIGVVLPTLERRLEIAQ
jgi:hypothetical protein